MSDTDKINPLELVATDDLLDEVLNRFDHAVFMGLTIGPDPAQPDAQKHYEKYMKVGNARTCQGLACGIIARIQHTRDETTQELEAGDDF